MKVPASSIVLSDGYINRAGEQLRFAATLKKL